MAMGERFGSRLGRSSALRIAAAAVAAVAVAELGVWLLRPRGEIPQPLPLSEGDLFSAAELTRLHDFRDGQRLLFLATLAVEGATLCLIALWRPAPLRRALDAAARRPLLGGAAVGGAIALTLTVVSLPLGAAAHERARDVGLATQTLGPWLGDAAKSAAIGTAFAAAGGTAAVALMRRLGRAWWAGGAVLVVVFATVVSWLAPVVLAPLFNRFDELPPGPLRSEVLRLGERAGVEVGEVYRVDASRRSTGLNAYVNGLGPTKRVVLYDNLIERSPADEVRSVVAHELGHVAGRDILRGIAFVALVAPLGALLVQLGGEALARRSGDDPRSPQGLPGIALALAAVSVVLGVAGNQLSRRVEARADAFALELTAEPRALEAVQRDLALTNLGDPEPPAAFQFLLASHPSTVERVGAARAFARERP